MNDFVKFKDMENIRSVLPLTVFTVGYIHPDTNYFNVVASFVTRDEAKKAVEWLDAKDEYIHSCQENRLNEWRGK